MTYKVLVVDDSGFFRERLREMIDQHPQLKVVAVATNGHEAIDLADKLHPDIISMDYEMPYLDGVSAVREIMAKNPTPIVMVSSMTYEGAKITLDALDAGAVDFIPKNFAEVSNNSSGLIAKLHNTFLTFARKQADKKEVTTQSVQQPKKIGTVAPSAAPGYSRLKNKIKLIVIGVSTGGPIALSEVLQKLPANYSVPIVVVQHMPESFTKALAERLNKSSLLKVAEASNGDLLRPGSILIAPGGQQLMLDSGGRVKVIAGDDRLNYKPSVDIAFASAANNYGAGVLGIVLTGMGKDGCEGARLIKQKGGVIWGQDQASSVIYGMPKAVANENLTDEVIPLSEIGPKLIKDI